MALASTTALTAILDLQAASDSGSSNTDDITNAASPVFAATFSESVSGARRRRLLQRRDCDRLRRRRAGRWSDRLHRDAHRLLQRHGHPPAGRGWRDDGGSNANAQTDGPTVTIDRTAPTVTLDLQAASDTGTSSTDDLTNATSPVFDVTFSETVTGLLANDFERRGRDRLRVRTGRIRSTYTVTVTGCSAGTLIVRVRPTP